MDENKLQEYPSKPYLTANGDLRIPFDSDPKYHHWKGGQSVLKTLQELGASLQVMREFQQESE